MMRSGDENLLHVFLEKRRPFATEKILFSVNGHPILLRGFEFVYLSLLGLECRGISVIGLF